MGPGRNPEKGRRMGCRVPVSKYEIDPSPMPEVPLIDPGGCVIFKICGGQDVQGGCIVIKRMGKTFRCCENFCRILHLPCGEYGGNFIRIAENKVVCAIICLGIVRIQLVRRTDKNIGNRFPDRIFETLRCSGHDVGGDQMKTVEPRIVPACSIARTFHAPIGDRSDQRIVVVVISQIRLERRGELLHVGKALDLVCGHPRLEQRRKEKSDKNCKNRNDN